MLMEVWFSISKKMCKWYNLFCTHPPSSGAASLSFPASFAAGGGRLLQTSTCKSNLDVIFFHGFSM
jgi:hypothetical protein